jgi:hypothetical protein
MNAHNVYSLFNNLQSDNLSFIYQGSFNDIITERIIDISETTISAKNEPGKISNKVSFLLAECFQNIIRYGDFSLSNIESSGIFVTRNIGKSYFISSANLIAKKEVEGLKKKLEQINTLSPEELKKLYLDVLTNNERTNKGGAGLGLIEMARKSGQKLEFDFEDVDQDYSYFYLQIKLKSPAESPEVNHQVDINVAKEFHHLMSEDNIFIIHKGDFSQHTIVPILRMIEDNLKGTPIQGVPRKKVFQSLVEILQNVSKHALEMNGVREGIFLMGKKDNNFLIYTGNFMPSSKVDALMAHIDNLNTMSKEALLELYKLTLHLGTTTFSGDAGLGLIDIARDSSDKLHYEFKAINDKWTFFTLGVKI